MRPERRVQIEIVDENPQPRQSIAFMLRCAGYGVRTHESSRHFVDKREQEVGSIVLMDIPGLEYGNACEDHCIKQTVALRPTIFMSALPEPKLMSDAFEIGIVEFLSKPFHKSSLIDAIETVLVRSTKFECGSKFQNTLPDSLERRFG